MTFTFLRIKALSFLLAACLLLPLSTAFAEEGLSVSVSPTIYDMTANPGQMWQSTVRIVNPNPFELSLSVTPTNFIPKEEDGVPQFVPLAEGDVVKDTLGEWISAEREITIGAEQTYELPFQIAVPEGASPGGHYAALMISTKTSDSGAKNSQVQTSQVISALIFLRVTGDITENSSIRSFRSTHYFLSKPETRFEVRVENRGNIHLQPQGEIKIYNMWGRERGTIPINQQTMLGNVLPQSVRKFSFEWSSAWSISDIGRYTAKVTLAYGKDERQFIAADTAFWIIPWKVLLLVFTIFGGLIAIVTWAIKLYVKRVLALAGVTQVPSRQTEEIPKSPRKKAATALTAKSVAAPIGVSILDLRSKLSRANGPWQERARVYISFAIVYWKFFVGAIALVLLVAAVILFIKDALTEERAYQVTDPVSGAVVASSDKEVRVENALGLPIAIVNRTADDSLSSKVAEIASKSGFTIATSTTENGAPEEKTVIVYNPEVSSQALLLSTILNNALLSAFTSNSSTTEKIVVYVGNDAIVE